MPDTFQYKVRDKSGNMVTGTLVADSELLVLQRLREMGYTPLEVGLIQRSRTALHTLRRRSGSARPACCRRARRGC